MCMYFLATRASTSPGFWKSEMSTLQSRLLVITLSEPANLSVSLAAHSTAGLSSSAKENGSVSFGSVRKRARNAKSIAVPRDVASLPPGVDANQEHSDNLSRLDGLKSARLRETASVVILCLLHPSGIQSRGV